MDAAVSCFRTFFSGQMDWSWSMENIAQHFINEDRLFCHWRQIFGDEILTVPYEKYVASPKVWTEKILAHCKLSDEHTSDNFYLSKQTATSASVEQVRRAIYQSSVGISKHYTLMMQPFAESYASFSA